MAMSKSIEQETGGTLTYWKILWMKQDTWRTSNVQIAVGGFIDATTRAQNKSVGEVKLYDFDTVALLTKWVTEVAAEPVLIYKPIKALYLELLTLPEWEGATEV